MISLAAAYFNHPVAKGVDHLLVVVDSTIEEAQDLVAELDTRYIAESVGEKQALEFTRLQKLTPKDFGPRQAEIVSRLSFRAGRPALWLPSAITREVVAERESLVVRWREGSAAETVRWPRLRRSGGHD